MTQYLLSVHSGVPGEVNEPMTAEQMRRTTEQIMALQEEMKAAGVWVFGGRLTEPDTATVVRLSAGEVQTTDGPFVESKEHLVGSTSWSVTTWTPRSAGRPGRSP